MLKTVSLSAIRAFEAAARHGSFRAAAAELTVSPSAVSHAVTNLEQALGTVPFDAEREPASGRPVAPLTGISREVRYVGHSLVYPKRGAGRRTLRVFAEWLLAELGEPPFRGRGQLTRRSDRFVCRGLPAGTVMAARRRRSPWPGRCWTSPGRILRERGSPVPARPDGPSGRKLTCQTKPP